MYKFNLRAFFGLLFLVVISPQLKAQFPMLIGVSPQECKAYYIEQGMEVYFDNEFPDEPASLIAESRDYTITTMFDHEVAIHASVLSKADLSFSMMYEQYEVWIQEGKHKHPSANDHSIVLSAFETTSEFPKLFIGLYDTQHKTETDQALKMLQCDWGLVSRFLIQKAESQLTKLGENTLPYFDVCAEVFSKERDDCTKLEIIKHVTKTMKFPRTQLDAKKRRQEIYEVVYVQFRVSEEGDVENIEIVKGVNSDYDEEAIRCVSTLPKFNPAILDGKHVPFIFTLPVKFVAR